MIIFFINDYVKNWGVLFMFLVWNEIKRNKIKFSLVIGILVFISYLLFLLLGFVNGFIKMNIEGIEKWNVDVIILKKEVN